MSRVSMLQLCLRVRRSLSLSCLSSIHDISNSCEIFALPPSRGRESRPRRQGWTRFFSATIAMDAFDAFDAAATELMLRQGIKASALHKRLRNITEAASQDLPLLQVLYCNCYGGYSYSEEFERFTAEKSATPDTLATMCALQNRVQSISDSRDDDLKSDSGNDNLQFWSRCSYEDRVRDVQQITQFGQHLMETWPGIAKLVKAYMRNDLKHRMEEIGLIERHRQKLLEYQKVRDLIAAEIGRSDGKTEWETWNLNSQWEDFSAYAPSALEAMRPALDAEENELTLEIQGKRDALLKHMTEAQYEAMLRSLGIKLPEEVEAAKALEGEAAKSLYAMYEEREKLSFSDAVTKYGEHHYAVWHLNPNHFDERVMQFLLLNPEYTEGLASERDNEKCALQLGLCAASGRHCRLRIAEVPRLAEWKVGEYDGLESVYLV